MSHLDPGPLATYNSLTDHHLHGYFTNTRKKRHLIQAGMINRRGEIVSESTYRLTMARKEHKKHVKGILAQAIVHKTLDLERMRQVEIRKKLEEIAKLELVRRVRTHHSRRGDEAILPYLSAPSSRPQSSMSSHSKGNNKRYRPTSAPNRASPVHRPRTAFGCYDDDMDSTGSQIVYLDDDGQPLSPQESSRPERESSKRGDNSRHRREEIDTRHLQTLDSATLQKYAKMMSRMNAERIIVSPYLIPQTQLPTPPKTPRSGRRSARQRRTKQTEPQTDRTDQSDTVQGTLMLHRMEPAMMNQTKVQTMCEVSLKYHGLSLTLPRDNMDPYHAVEVEQQHCGGNTLAVFKERILPGSEFSFISRRHRGYPFSLTLYVNGVHDSRVSTCCEYGHATGTKLGGKQGHFTLTSVTGSEPCYRCKVAISNKRKKKQKNKKKDPEYNEEVTAEAIPATQEADYIIAADDDEEYEDDDDFEDDDEAPADKEEPNKDEETKREDDVKKQEEKTKAEQEAQQKGESVSPAPPLPYIPVEFEQQPSDPRKPSDPQQDSQRSDQSKPEESEDSEDSSVEESDESESASSDDETVTEKTSTPKLEPFAVTTDDNYDRAITGISSSGFEQSRNVDLSDSESDSGSEYETDSSEDEDDHGPGHKAPSKMVEEKIIPVEYHQLGGDGTLPPKAKDNEMATNGSTRNGTNATRSDTANVNYGKEFQIQIDASKLTTLDPKKRETGLVVEVERSDTHSESSSGDRHVQESLIVQPMKTYDGQIEALEQSDESDSEEDKNVPERRKLQRSDTPSFDEIKMQMMSVIEALEAPSNAEATQNDDEEGRTNAKQAEGVEQSTSGPTFKFFEQEPDGAKGRSQQPQREGSKSEGSSSKYETETESESEKEETQAVPSKEYVTVASVHEQTETKLESCLYEQQQTMELKYPKEVEIVPAKATMLNQSIIVEDRFAAESEDDSSSEYESETDTDDSEVGRPTSNGQPSVLVKLIAPVGPDVVPVQNTEHGAAIDKFNPPPPPLAAEKLNPLPPPAVADLVSDSSEFETDTDSESETEQQQIAPTTNKVPEIVAPNERTSPPLILKRSTAPPNASDSESEASESETDSESDVGTNKQQPITTAAPVIIAPAKTESPAQHLMLAVAPRNTEGITSSSEYETETESNLSIEQQPTVQMPQRVPQVVDPSAVDTVQKPLSSTAVIGTSSSEDETETDTDVSKTDQQQLIAPAPAIVPDISPPKKPELKKSIASSSEYETNSDSELMRAIPKGIYSEITPRIKNNISSEYETESESDESVNKEPLVAVTGPSLPEKEEPAVDELKQSITPHFGGSDTKTGNSSSEYETDTDTDVEKQGQQTLPTQINTAQEQSAVPAPKPVESVPPKQTQVAVEDRNPAETVDDSSEYETDTDEESEVNLKMAQSTPNTAETMQQGTTEQGNILIERQMEEEKTAIGPEESSEYETDTGSETDTDSSDEDRKNPAGSDISPQTSNVQDPVRPEATNISQIATVSELKLESIGTPLLSGSVITEAEIRTGVLPPVQPDSDSSDYETDTDSESEVVETPKDLPTQQQITETSNVPAQVVVQQSSFTEDTRGKEGNKMMETEKNDQPKTGLSNEQTTQPGDATSSESSSSDESETDTDGDLEEDGGKNKVSGKDGNIPTQEIMPSQEVFDNNRLIREEKNDVEKQNDDRLDKGTELVPKKMYPDGQSETTENGKHEETDSESGSEYETDTESESDNLGRRANLFD